MKTITPIFDRSSGRLEVEYQADYDGNCIGFFPNHSAAEEALNDYVLGLAEQGLLDAPLAELAAEPDPGDDCPDHGPYADDDCPKCATCNDSGLIPSNGCGDACGGWAEYCPDCRGVAA